MLAASSLVSDEIQPNLDILDYIDMKKESQHSQSELRATFLPYFHDMAPFYLDLLTIYMECLSK